MAYDKLIDSEKLDTALTATADAIRAKTGSEEAIAWGEDGFAGAVEGIPVGSNGEYSFDNGFHAAYTKIVRVGDNTVTNCVAAWDYFQALIDGSLQFVILLDAYGAVANQYIGRYSSSSNPLRFRDGAPRYAQHNAGYDGALVEGTTYFIASSLSPTL